MIRMTKYNLVETVYVAFLRAKYNAFRVIDNYRPHLFLKKNLTDYRTSDFYGMEVGEVLDFLNINKEKVKLTY